MQGRQLVIFAVRVNRERILAVGSAQTNRLLKAWQLSGPHRSGYQSLKQKAERGSGG
jgi:hypothetical protein